MKKKYIFFMIVNIVTSISIIQARYEQNSIHNDGDQCVSKQQSFIASNGMLGIYQPLTHKAFIDNDSYEQVQAILLQSHKKVRKPKKKIFIGTLIDGDNIYELYGKNHLQAPIYSGPDADVRTEEKLSESFMRDFGSGQYTPDDKWD